MQLLVTRFTIKMFHTDFMQILAQGQHDGSIHIQTVYTATTQTDGLNENWSNNIILAHFIANTTNSIF